RFVVVRDAIDARGPQPRGLELRRDGGDRVGQRHVEVDALAIVAAGAGHRDAGGGERLRPRHAIREPFVVRADDDRGVRIDDVESDLVIVGDRDLVTGDRPDLTGRESRAYGSRRREHGTGVRGEELPDYAGERQVRERPRAADVGAD